MTNAIALSIHQVSKKYKLFNSPQERVWEALHPFKKKFHRDFWALKEVSLQIQKGQTLGIIGRNGSGKSTLLQLMAGVLKPTSGTIEVSGRISALLELGAGFNPEFTGRENIRFYGLLMGLSDVEIKNKIPEIETFADIGEFIDQPVKIYSSGMFVRLAFSAAIHVDPDILIIDEALAVGDAKFQHKCYQKFREFQEQGKTIIFVTHDMHAILKHCDHAFLMEAGSIVVSGKPSEVVHHYHELILNNRTGVEKNQ
jgi:ABC-type polysaccharide/polyol phosphate transport system ATPase subunit